MKKIVVINGSGGVGKDTFVMICDKLTGFGVLSFSSVDFVKKIARECGWDGGKTEKDRKFLAGFKDLLTDYNDLPFIEVMKKSFEFAMEDSDKMLLFIHDRNVSEIKRIVEITGAITLLITNPNVPLVKSNSADAGVFDYDYDYNVNNDGTVDDLKKKAEKFLEEIGVPYGKKLLL